VIDHRWQVWLAGWATAALLLGVLYLLQRRTRDATAVDAGWALSLVAIAVLAAVLGPGRIEHAALIATIAGLENLRVALVVSRRIGKGEDSRYQELRARWRARGREQSTFAIFYEAQALLAAILALPFVLAVFATHRGLAPVEWAGLALWLVAVVFGTLSDEQLRRFKADPANRGRTMRSGLWRLSRHPNYFFQSLAWIAYALVACAAPWGWLGFLSPILLVLLIVFVTGIPPSEEAALRSRGEEYRRYQRETSVFIPWFPKSSKS
jgi:steroid 5-alpha reductase family enzyme